MKYKAILLCPNEEYTVDAGWMIVGKELVLVDDSPAFLILLECGAVPF